LLPFLLRLTVADSRQMD